MALEEIQIGERLNVDQGQNGIHQAVAHIYSTIVPAPWVEGGNELQGTPRVTARLKNDLAVKMQWTSARWTLIIEV
jgi:hypothetical protein